MLGFVTVVAALLALAPQDSTFVGVDFAWRANGTAATTLTVSPQTTVTFSYPQGSSFHNLRFTGASKPACTGPIDVPRPPGWSSACTFPSTGRYPFVCDVHADAGMAGTVVVEVPETPAPTPTATAPPGDAPAPVATATPPPEVAPKLAVKLAARQRGARIRGTVEMPRAGARVEITVKHGRRRAGRSRRTAAKAGALRFSVPLDARARRALKARRRLALTVSIRLTDTTTRIRTAKVTVSL